MLPYTPFTSEDLSTATGVVSDLSAVTGGLGNLPSAQQVVFFTVGIICLIASLALIIGALAENPDVQNIVKLAAVA